MITRTIMWTALYVLLLGTCTIRAEYTDGLVIQIKGWLFK